ncbi:hypothetical protein VIS19158_11718 [Vibrio scophthalmi LMG 19158]|uniref:Uncharacterized protein n=1 Tax=Vibrio scophthalmi LMG 19158 TaxID=870967 RepID=F9RID1_9VIBR|nr:hypothetical protein VIS19158_11718 [Vibrio scophthalmi LMG 19158]
MEFLFLPCFKQEHSKLSFQYHSISKFHSYGENIALSAKGELNVGR